jgi:hypothetical protein
MLSSHPIRTKGIYCDCQCFGRAATAISDHSDVYTQKRKLSGLTGLELRVAIQALTTLKNSLFYEEVTPGPYDVDAGEAQAGESLQEERVDIFDERLEGMVQLMQSKLEEPLVRWTYITCFVCLIFYSHLPSAA